MQSHTKNPSSLSGLLNPISEVKTPSVLLKKLRTHYFFVDEPANLQYFLENTEVEFRITDGPKWNKPLAFASAYPFTHFKIPDFKKEKDYV